MNRREFLKGLVSLPIGLKLLPSGGDVLSLGIVDTKESCQVDLGDYDCTCSLNIDFDSMTYRVDAIAVPEEGKGDMFYTSDISMLDPLWYRKVGDEWERVPDSELNHKVWEQYE